MRNACAAVVKAFIGMLIAWGALWLVRFLPQARLDTPFATGMVWFTHSADVIGAVALGLACVALVVLRTPMTVRRCLRETATHIVVVGLLLGGGALANEYFIKPSFAVPRPNIERLAAADRLGMSAEAFYNTMDTEARQEHLREVLSGPDGHAVPLTACVRDHWIREAGYALPSGHAFSAMLLATYFFAVGSTIARRRIYFLLPLWAVLIGGSRVILGVHRPEDVVWGGAMGVVLGVVAFFSSRRLLRSD
jgi:phosphatidylglycerophosphatase B